MSRARLFLDDRKFHLKDRIERAREVSQALIERYPHYIAGHVLRFEVDQMLADLQRHGIAGGDAALAAEQQLDAGAIGMLDPEIADLVRLAYFRVSYDEANFIKGAVANQSKTRNDANTRLDVLSSSFVAAAMRAYGSSMIARTEARRVVPLAVSLFLKEHDLEKASEAARGGLAKGAEAANQLRLCLDAAKAASLAQEYLAEEDSSLMAERRAKDDATVVELLRQVETTPLSTTFAYVF